MSACAGESEFVAGDPIDQEPIGGDVCLAEALLLALERMVLVNRIQRLLGRQRFDQGPELSHRQIPSCRQPNVSPESARSNGLAQVRFLGL